MYTICSWEGFQCQYPNIGVLSTNHDDQTSLRAFFHPQAMEKWVMGSRPFDKKHDNDDDWLNNHFPYMSIVDFYMVGMWLCHMMTWWWQWWWLMMVISMTDDDDDDDTDDDDRTNCTNQSSPVWQIRLPVMAEILVLQTWIVWSSLFWWRLKIWMTWWSRYAKLRV